MRMFSIFIILVLISSCTPIENELPVFTEVACFEVENPDRVLDVVSFEKTVYVANFSGGIQIYTLYDVNDIKLLKTIPTDGFAQRFYLHDTLLFVANRDNGIRVYNVKDPQDPFLAKYSNETYTLGICGDDSYAYSAGQDEGVAILSLKNDSLEAEILSSLPELYTANNCLIDGEYLYSANWEKGTAIIDVKDKMNPKIVKIYPCAQGSSSYYSSEVVKIKNFIVSAAGAEGIKIIDVSNPEESFETSVLKIEDEVLEIASNGKDLIFAGTLSEGIYVVKISDDGIGKILYHYVGSGDSRGIFYEDGYVLIASQSTSTIRIVKVENTD